MQTGKAALDNMRTSPVEIPVLNRLKRKQTNSPEPLLPHPMQSNKKQRPDSDNVPLAPPRFPAEPEFAVAHAHPAPSVTPWPADTQPAALPRESVAASQAPVVGSPHPMDRHAQREIPAVSTQRPECLPMEDSEMSVAVASNDLKPLQQVIENEFNMQILMKHNELRLIEQELAKCQIALEQLRRCELRPYPGADQPADSVSAGVGPALAPPSGYTRPTHSAPHGVVDGPYSRHYRQWLLHDPHFDAVSVHSQLLLDSNSSGPVRSTRYSGTARKSVGRAFAAPSRGSDPLQSIPNYPAPAPKDKSSPLVLRRSTDGQLVKLICNNCQRGNFSSIQGFLNHCRIAHKVDYKSHDAAAVDCGRLLDEHEAANLPPETQHAPPPKPAASRPSSTVSTPFKNLVHPMNTVGGVPILAGILPQPHARPAKAGMASASLVNPKSTQASSSSFKPSTQAPRLSAHFAKHHLGGDLEQAIINAKQKIDLGADEDTASPDPVGPISPSVPLAGSRTVAGVGRVGAFAPVGPSNRPPSRKGQREPIQRHRPAPLAPTPPMVASGLKQEHSEIPESPQDHSSNLSPHAADSNPGLVSDHEDDDHGSASEDETPQAAIAHSLGVRTSGCTDNMDIDVTVDDDIDQHGVVIRRNSMLVADDRGMRTTAGGCGPSRKLGTGHDGA